MSISTKTNVLYVITKSNFGGAQRYVFDLARSLPREQFEVAVALGGTGERGAEPGRLKELLEAAGVRTLVVGGFMRDMALVSDLRAFFELGRIILRERPDVLHASSSKAGGIGALLGRAFLLPRVVFTSHGLTFDEAWRPRWQRALIYAGTWLTIALAHATIMVSRDTYERARRMPLVGRKVHLIHNGVAPSALLSRANARAALAARVDQPNLVEIPLWIGTISELHPNKGIGNTLAALAELPSRENLVFYVIGNEGGGRAQLEEQVRALGLTRHVVLAGPVPDAPQYLAAFDVFTLTSLKEGLPYVLLEAGGAALPVVASAAGGIPDIIEDGLSGSLVDGRDRLATGSALEAYLTDPEKRAAHGGELKRTVERDFSIFTMVEGTTRLYNPGG